MAHKRGFEDDSPRFALYKTGPGEPFEPTPEEREFESLLGGAATSDVVEQTGIEQSTENMAARQEHTFTQLEATASKHDDDLKRKSEEAYEKELIKYGIDPATIPINDRIPRHLVLRTKLEHAKADGLQRNEEQTVVPQTISHLEAFVAIAFDECNLSSEAARNHALAITRQHKGQARQLFVVDPDTEPQTVTSFEKLILLPRITLQYGPLFTGSDEQVQLVLDATNTNNLGQPKPVILAIIMKTLPYLLPVLKNACQVKTKVCVYMHS